jgi:hypothetical protein
MEIEIGTYDDMMKFLKLEKSTLYKMVCHHKLPDGVYLNHGRFNLTKLKRHIEDHGTFCRLKPKKAA